MLSEAVLQYVKEGVVNVGGFERTEFVAADEGRFEMRAYPGSDCGNNIGTVPFCWRLPTWRAQAR